MKVVILMLIVIAALSAIASGVWVAIALVRAVSRREETGKAVQKRFSSRRARRGKRTKKASPE